MPPRALSGGSYDFHVPRRFIRIASRCVSAGRGAAALTYGASRTKHAENFKYNAKAESGEEVVPPRALSSRVVPMRFLCATSVHSHRITLRCVSAGRGAVALTDGASRTKHAEKFKYTTLVTSKAESGDGEEIVPPRAPSRVVGGFL